MGVQPSTTWSRIGDLTHLALILNASAFAYAVVMHNESDLFDPVWQPEGFCVANRDVPYMNSHDLCLYFDTIFALIHGLVYLGLRNQPGMDPANELVKFNIIGIMGHGLGHGAIAKGIRDGINASSSSAEDSTSSGLSGFEIMQSLSFLEAIKTMIPYVIFWILLMKATMPTAKWSVVSLMTALSFVGNIFVPERFGFTYVQTVLLLAFSIHQLLRPSSEKGFAYALFPIIAGFPVSKYYCIVGTAVLMMCCSMLTPYFHVIVGVIAWIESTMCSKGVIDIGGHCKYRIGVYASSFL